MPSSRPQVILLISGGKRCHRRRKKSDTRNKKESYKNQKASPNEISSLCFIFLGCFLLSSFLNFTLLGLINGFELNCLSFFFLFLTSFLGGCMFLFFLPHLPSKESHQFGSVCALLHLKFPAFKGVTQGMSFKHNILLNAIFLQFDQLLGVLTI